MYGASRTLTALAQNGQAPKIFAYVDRRGRPLPSVILSLAMGFLSFLIYSTSQTTVFDWLLALSGLSTIFSWGSVTLCHIRFRMAWKHAGHTLEELPWKAPTGVIGSIWATFFCALVVIFQIIIGAWPIDSVTPSERADGFFQSCLALPVVILFFIIGSLDWDAWFRSSWAFRRIGGVPVMYWPTRTWRPNNWVPLEQIDIVTSRRMIPLDILRQEREEAKSMPWYIKIKDFFF